MTDAMHPIPIGGRQRRQRPIFAGDRRQATAKRQGLSRVQIAALIERQGGRCALCRTLLASNYTVDHDHRLGATHGHRPERGCKACVRGLLCFRCNGFLVGDYGEPEFLRRAATYAESRRR